MHSSFLYHGIKHGMNMGSVNPTMLEIYDNIPKDLLEYVEDVILNRRDDATERLLDFAETVSKKDIKEEKIVEKEAPSIETAEKVEKKNETPKEESLKENPKDKK